MRPVSLEIQAFRGWKGRTELQLSGSVTAIIAPNKAGKSSTLNALEWCLFGDEICSKTKSQINERTAWEIRPRGEEALPTKVRLVLETADGNVAITRTSSGEAKKKSTSTLEIRLPDGTLVHDEEAGAWLRQAGAPDWDTYRRAHCFHQEAARNRVLDRDDRNRILATLLGLEDDLRIRDAVRAQLGDIVGSIEKEREGLEKHVASVLDRPRREMERIEASLKQKGLDRTQLHDGKILEVCRELLLAAGALAAKLGTTPELPGEEDAAAVLKWARTWPQAARADTPVLAPLVALRTRAAELAGLIPAIEVIDRDWDEASKALDVASKKEGDRAAREKRLELARTRSADAKDALSSANERVALLIGAAKYLPLVEPADHCPVCESHVTNLAARIDKTLESLRTAEIVELTRVQNEAESEEREADDALKSFSALEKSLIEAKKRRDAKRLELAGKLGAAETVGSQDVLALARQAIEALTRRIATLDALAGERDKALDDHTTKTDLLKDLDGWSDASRRADAQIDVHASPEWVALDDAIDAAAGFVADVEAVAEIAREAQAARSTEREQEVNCALGKYYRMIVADDASADVILKSKPAANTFVYELVDAEGRQAVPILNQASINALSLALLFAQAEDQARKGGFGCVVLDDPVQSLDDERQKGLAAAIEELSKTCSVLVAATPSPFVDRLEKYVAVRRTLQYLEPYDSNGSRMGERREL